MSKTMKTKNQEAGFTLLETSIALVVMMVGALGIAGVLSYSVRNNTGSRDRVTALAVAQQQMEQLRHVPFTNAALTATSTNPTAVSVHSAGRDYSVRTRITDTTASIKTIEIQVTPLLGNDAWSNRSVTIVAQRAAFTLGPFSGGL